MRQPAYVTDLRADARMLLVAPSGMLLQEAAVVAQREPSCHRAARAPLAPRKAQP